MRTSHVQSVHLSYRVASAGHGTGRDDAVDFRKILGHERNVRGAHILLKVLARFRAGYRDAEGSRTLSLGDWPRDGELSERGVLAARNGLERRTQPEVLLDIDTLKARQPLANVVRCQFLHFGNLVAQHPASEHGIGHHCHAKFLAGVDLALLFRIAREQRILHLQRNERMNGTATLQRLGRALRERDETCLAFLDELAHSPNAFLDRHVRIDARHAKDVERLDAKIFQALLAGLPQITRITSAAHGVWAAVTWAAALRVDDNIMSAAADCFADQAVIVALAVAGRCVEEIDSEIEREANGGD